MRKNFWYCLTSAFFGSVRMLISVSTSSGSSVAHERQAADELGDHAELDQVFRLHLRQHFGRGRATVSAGDVLAVEADLPLAQALADDVFQPDERAAADEQDLRRVHLDVLLLGMLAAALRRDVGDVPSSIFSSACCTPSPLTSRVMLTLFCVLPILSISSM